MSQTKRNLPKKQLDAIEALMRHTTNEEAAKAAAVTVRTLYRWLADDHEFIAALKAKRAELFENAKNVVQTAMIEAAAKLCRVVREEETASAASIMACRTMLQFGIRLQDIDVDQRIAELERMAVELAARRPVQ